MFTRFEILGDQDADFDGLVVDFFIGGAVGVEAVEASFWRGVVERCHGLGVGVELELFWMDESGSV
jgi:hypothetical protein